MKKIILFLLCSLSIHSYGQNTMETAKNLGNFAYSFETKSDTQNTANFTNDYAGRPSNDVFYKFRLLKAMEIVITHCGSAVADTYLHLLDSSGERIAYNDDYSGYLGCSQTRQACIIKILPPGIYYIVSEGYSQNGEITTNISGVGIPHFYPVSEIDQYDGTFDKSVSGHSAYSENYYLGLNTKQLFYQFILDRSMEVTIDHCGSEVEDTYMLLLNSKGDIIASNDNYTGAGTNCSNTKLAFIKKILPEGTYYVVSQGKTTDGYIETNLHGEASPTVFPVTDIGSKERDFEYSDTKNSSSSQNYYNGKYLHNPIAAKDIIYKFTLTRAINIEISQCGTSLDMTNLHLLNAMGNQIATIYYSSANKCNSKINRDLPVGTYYVVSEGYMYDGEITTNIKGSFNEYVNRPEPETSRNFIRARTYLTDQEHNYMDNIRFYDGLGRLIQQNQAWGGGNRQDLVTCIEYDDLGGESKIWRPLPLPKTNNGSYYAGDRTADAKNDYYYRDEYGYYENVYENSPLHRPVKKYGPGSAWREGNGHAAQIEYLSNSATYPCNYYTVSGDNLVKNNTYANNTLEVVKYTDEDGSVSYEFTDKFGRLLLSRQMNGSVKHDTYYIYDPLGNLRFVLPPMASENLGSNTTYNPSSNLYLLDYAYIYKYDSRGRCIEKKLPGRNTWPVYFVYDKTDRLIFSQDGEQRALTANRWTFYKYDTHGKMLMKGVCELTSSLDVNTLRTKLADRAVTDTFHISKPNYGYSAQVHAEIPFTVEELLQVNYYDNYDFTALAVFGQSKFQYQPVVKGYNNRRYGTDSDKVAAKGLLTGTLLLRPDMNQRMLGSVFYYDKKGNVIQSIAANHLDGFEKEYVNYSHTNKPLKKIITHSRLHVKEIKQVYTYSYDHVDRLKTTLYSLDDQPEIPMSNITYNLYGQIESKSLYGNAEVIHYEFNIRDQLKRMYSANFNQKLYYEQSTGSNTPSFNGNISQMSWMSSNQKADQHYLYTYDPLNRLTKGQYRQDTYSGYNNTKNYSEEVAYNKMGNITQLKRSKTGTGYMDNLTLAYVGNLLNKATETGDAAKGFLKPGVTLPAKEYEYNKNGSLQFDHHTGISNMSYTSLGMPFKIQFRPGHIIQYSYNGAGKKLRTVHTTTRNNLNVPLGSFQPLTSYSVASVLTTDYCGSIVYENGKVKYILTPEGYISESYGDRHMVHHYYLKDHLGNNRMVIALGGYTHTAQETEYYPFGLPFPRGKNPGYQPFKFGGKELDEMYGLNWYDQGARPFGGLVPRTPVMDPLAEKYYSISPYAQWANNPVRYIDPDGREWLKADDQVFANSLITAMSGKISIHQQSIEKLNTTIAKKKAKGKNTLNDELKVEELQTSIQNLNAGIGELNEMGETKEQVFTYEKTSENRGEADLVDGLIIMTIANNGSISNGIHESSHGYDIWKNGGVYGRSNYMLGEIKAYRRQFSFDKQTLPVSDFGRAKSLKDIDGRWIFGINSNGSYLYIENVFKGKNPKDVLNDFK
ncbi:MAG: DUF6443 domain-containing protein [Bacteroidales bacterium]|nr:DUF6443 domain-containing protein [Bacteroidales bacterium]